MEGHLYRPLCAEAFGATVRWKDEIKTVYIDANKTDKVEDEDDTRK